MEKGNMVSGTVSHCHQGWDETQKHRTEFRPQGSAILMGRQMFSVNSSTWQNVTRATHWRGRVLFSKRGWRFNSSGGNSTFSNLSQKMYWTNARRWMYQDDSYVSVLPLCTKQLARRSIVPT